LVRALKRHEGVDYFDIDTNFNPLRFENVAVPILE